MNHDDILIFEDEKTLMIDKGNEFSIGLTKSKYAPAFCHKKVHQIPDTTGSEGHMTLAEAASKAENKTYFIEELACRDAPRFFINR